MAYHLLLETHTPSLWIHSIALAWALSGTHAINEWVACTLAALEKRAIPEEGRNRWGETQFLVGRLPNTIIDCGLDRRKFSKKTQTETLPGKDAITGETERRNCNQWGNLKASCNRQSLEKDQRDCWGKTRLLGWGKSDTITWEGRK